MTVEATPELSSLSLLLLLPERFLPHTFLFLLKLPRLFVLIR